MIRLLYRLPLAGLSLRLKLTIFYSLILGLTLALFGVFVSLTLGHMLSGEADRSVVQETLIHLHLLLALGVLCCVGLSTLLGWLLAHAALAPMDHVTLTAKAIGQSRDFSQRVQYHGPRDEIGRLAATFNGMLEQLEAAFGDLRSAHDQLQTALAAQQRFAAEASHELRTPLTTILGNAGLLLDAEMTPEDRQASVAQIHVEAERMSRLVQELLTLARLDADQSPQRQPVNLRSLMDEVIAQGRVLAQDVELRSGDLAEAVVEGDRDHLKQLLLILLDNALKYTRPGGLVTLSLRCASSCAEILVRDTGAGIAKHELPRIFDRFYRGGPARKSGGIGLGLAIAQRIVREHGGDIQVRSRLGRGSSFIVRLPSRLL